MSKKLSIAAVSLLTILGLSVFSLSNAFALENEPNGSGDGGAAAPLTSAVQICKELRANYKAKVANEIAYGLSVQLSRNAIIHNINYIKNYKNLACGEAVAELK